MRALGLVIAALLGGIFGFVATAVVAVPILQAGSGIADGSAAMGAMFVVAPIGAIVGALVGFFAAAAATREKPVDRSVGDETAARESVSDAPGDGTGKSRSRSNQPLIAFGILAAIVAGIYFSLFYEYTPPHFPIHGRKPSLLFEVRVPNAAIVEDDFFWCQSRAALVAQFHFSGSPHETDEGRRDDNLFRVHPHVQQG